MSEPRLHRPAPWRPALLAAAWLLAAAGCRQASPEPAPEPATTTRPVPTLGPDEAVPQPAGSGLPGASDRAGERDASHDHPDRDPRRP